MRRLLTPVATGLLVLLSACGGNEEASNGRTAKTANGLYTLAYSPSPDPIPFSELFELDVSVKNASNAPVTDANVSLKVTMPAHGHGMQTSPQISSVGDGHYKVTGMKFHMHGAWELIFTVESGAGTDSVSFTEDFE